MSPERNGTGVSESLPASPPQEMETPIRQKRYVDLKTAADMMSFSEATTRRLVDSGRMPVIRIPPVTRRKPEQKKTGRSKDILRIEVRDIDSFMRKHKRLC